jgi:hypothetical protein
LLTSSATLLQLHKPGLVGPAAPEVSKQPGRDSSYSQVPIFEDKRLRVTVLPYLVPSFRVHIVFFELKSPIEPEDSYPLDLEKDIDLAKFV